MVGLGVADGVYGWKEQGIDSGLFSRTLMRYAREAIADGTTDPLGGVHLPPLITGSAFAALHTTMHQPAS